MKKIALIIVHFGNPEVTYRCVESINDLALELIQIIIVNNSDKKLENIDFKKVIMVDSKENIGYAGGCNLGIKEAMELNFDHFLICNNDIVFTKNFFIELIQKISEIKDPFIAAPKILTTLQPDKIWYNGGSINKFKMEAIHDTKDSCLGFKKTDFVNGCCFYLSKQVIDGIGYLDENLFLYQEDLDFSLRAKKHSIGLFIIDTAIIYHKISSATSSNNIIGKYKTDIYYYLLRNKRTMINAYSNFPFRYFALGYLYYKLLKYLILFLLRLDFRNIHILFKAMRNKPSKQKITYLVNQ